MRSTPLISIPLWTLPILLGVICYVKVRDTIRRIRSFR